MFPKDGAGNEYLAFKFQESLSCRWASEKGRLLMPVAGIMQCMRSTVGGVKIHDLTCCTIPHWHIHVMLYRYDEDAGTIKVYNKLQQL